MHFRSAVAANCAGYAALVAASAALQRAAARVRLSGLLRLAKFAIFQNFAEFWRARSRLYQNEIL